MRLWQLGAVGYNSDEAVYSGTAASLAGDQRLAQFFPVFRAHPMMLQTILSWVYRTGVSDAKGRAVVVAFGLVTIWVTYLLGRLLYNQTVGLAAAAFVAVMPYAVVVSRQVLLDAPATLFVTMALYCTARYCRDRSRPGCMPRRRPWAWPFSPRRLMPFCWPAGRCICLARGTCGRPCGRRRSPEPYSWSSSRAGGGPSHCPAEPERAASTRFGNSCGDRTIRSIST